MSDLPAIPRAGAPVSAGEVVALERQLADALPSVSDFDLLDEWRDQAKALEAYLRGRDLQGPMLGAQRRIEARIGELLGEAKVGKSNPHHDEISHDQTRSDFRLLARAARECDLADEEWRRSRRSLVADVRRRLGLTSDAPPLPEGCFRCIVADPPWQLTTGATMPGKFGDIAIKDGADDLAYGQMSVAEIAALDVPSRAAEDSHLYLWTVNRHLEAAFEIARAWGFEPSALLTWCKAEMGVGLGGTRQTSEFCLFARRGSLAAEQIVPRTWWEWPRGRHSVKPEAFYELVRSVTPGPRLEMFTRKVHDGFEPWGDQVDAAA